MKKIFQIINIVVDIISLILIISGTIFHNYSMIVFAVTFILFGNILYSLLDIKKRIVFFMFNVSFGTLLVGKKFIEVLTGDIVNIFSNDIETNTIILLYLSLVLVRIGIVSSDKIKFKSKKDSIKKNKSEDKSAKIEYVKKISKYMFYITYIVLMMITLERVFFVQRNGYLSLYTNFKSIFPMVLRKISEACILIFYVFLGTMPKKSECKKVLILYQIYLLISIFSGVRSTFVLGEIIIVIYYFVRDNVNDEIWITKKIKIIFPIVCIIAIIGLGSYNVLRNSKDTEIVLSKQFVQFFKDQGGSINVISYSQYYKDEIEELKQNYTFGPIINYFRRGIFGKIFIGDISFNRKQEALYGNNLGATLSYKVLGNRYLNGEGIGTQYIAELYTDFGYVGVIIYNLLLGIVMGKIMEILSQKNNCNPYIFAMSLTIFDNIVYIPRDFAMSWFINLISIGNVTTLLSIFILSDIVYKKKYKKS